MDDGKPCGIMVEGPTRVGLAGTSPGRSAPDKLGTLSAPQFSYLQNGPIPSSHHCADSMIDVTKITRPAHDT